MSWERLSAMAAAHRRLDAEQMLLLTIVAQCDEKGWQNQIQMLRRQIAA